MFIITIYDSRLPWVNELNEGRQLMYVDLCGKEVNTMEVVPLINEDLTIESINSFKNALLSTITKLNDTIDFLKNELEENFLLIRILLLRDANDIIDYELLNRSIVETTSSDTGNINISNNQTCESSITQGYHNIHDNNGDILNESVNNSDSVNNSSLITIDYNVYISTLSGHTFSESSILNETFVIKSTKSQYESLDDQLKNYRSVTHNNYINDKVTEALLIIIT